MTTKKTDLPEVLELDFVICDETVNRYNWRLLVSGIDTTGFLQNPVCVVQHRTQDVPVGRWKNLVVADGKLQGTLEFDRNDELAVMYYLKYKNGYMNAVSLHVIPIEESNDPLLLLQGQMYPTLVKSELLEVSLVTIPGNKNAVKLCNPDGTEYKLQLIEKVANKKKMEKPEQTIADLKAQLECANKLNADNLIGLHKQRGVVTDSEVEHLRELALGNYSATSKMLDARVIPTLDQTPNLDANAKALVKLHFERGVINATEMSVWETAASLNFDDTKKVLEAKVGTDSVNTFLQSQSSGSASTGDDRGNWTYLDYYKKDHAGLMLMQEKEPEKYEKLEKAWVETSKKEFDI